MNGLPDDYLRYPHRAYGMDQTLYAWRPVVRRPALTWPDGRTLQVMVVVPLEFHMLNPAGKPFKHPGAMVTPYPDLRHYTTRDYGLRVGAYRILDALRRAGVRATFPVNAVLLDRVRPLIDRLLSDGHEIAAYGVDTDHIHHGGLDPAVERDWIAGVRARFAAMGLEPKTWMSPARQQSFRTLDLIREAGFEICLDWEADSAPLSLSTPSGETLSLPLSNELDDRTLLIDRRQDEATFARQVLEAADFMAAEAQAVGGQVLGFTLTPYVSGQPFRAKAVATLLNDLASRSGVAAATAAEIAGRFWSAAKGDGAQRLGGA